MATIARAPGGDARPLPPVAPRGTGSLPRPRSSGLVQLLRGVSLLLVLALLLAVATLGALQVLQSSRTAAAGYELRALESQRAELSAQVRLLEADVAQRASLEDVYVAATERLGMVRPESELRVTVGVPAPDVVPMPERYIHPLPAPTAQAGDPWWEQLLRGIPGLE